MSNSQKDDQMTRFMYSMCRDTTSACRQKIDDTLDKIVWTEWPANLDWNNVDINLDSRRAMKKRLTKKFCDDYMFHGWCPQKTTSRPTTTTTTFAPTAPTAPPGPPQGQPLPPAGPPQQMPQMQQPQTLPPPTTEGFLAANISLIIGGAIGLALLCLIGCSVILYLVKQSSEKKPAAPAPGNGSKSQMSSAGPTSRMSRMDKPKKHRKHRKHPKKEKEPESDGTPSAKSSVKGVKSKSLYNV